MEKMAALGHKDSVEFTLQLMTPAFEEQALAFKSKYLGSRGGAAFTDWKYRQGPIDSRACIILALAADGTIVGHLAAVVYPTVPGCSVPRLALGTEFIVDKKFRGGKHAVIPKMDEMLGECLAQMGVKLIYATPNRQGYLVTKRLFNRVDGPTCVYQSMVFTPALWLPQGPLRKAVHRVLTFGRFLLPRLPTGWSWDRIGNFVESDIESFCREFMRDIEFGVCRNADYLNWRYGSGDGFSYEKIRLVQAGKLMGLAVLRVDPSRCEAAALMEFMALDSGGYDLLLGICIHLASRSAPILTVMAVVDSDGFGVYQRHGFRSNSEILREIGRALIVVPRKIREFLVAKAENHFHLDDHLTIYNYADPSQSKNFTNRRWYISLGEKIGF